MHPALNCPDRGTELFRADEVVMEPASAGVFADHRGGRRILRRHLQISEHTELPDGEVLRSMWGTRGAFWCSNEVMSVILRRGAATLEASHGGAQVSMGEKNLDEKGC